MVNMLHLNKGLDPEYPIPLAIVGLSFEFPQGATSEDEFWRVIVEGRNTSTSFPRNRLNIDAFYHHEHNRPGSWPLRSGSFVAEDIAAFDAPFFSISPAEASCMDPQHRRLLETAYLALEDAGISLQQCSGSDTCVYTGCFTNDYLGILTQDHEAEQKHAALGISPAMLANRLSWFFNFKGTSMNIDSACSSSLIALHLACQELRSGSASMGVVGGANLVYHPDFMKMMTDFNFLSPDGRSWSFDEKANGYARGEGSAVIIVKRLHDAIRNGDTIRAVIRHTNTNQDGRTPGITVPSQPAQVELIQQAYREAGVTIEPTKYFEAHGTGTPVGDPIEANAIGTAFAGYYTPSDPLFIGSVKANIGHLEGCSGLAGVIKAILVLERGIIPPIAGLTNLNPKIDTQKYGLEFPKEPLKWPSAGLRRACVNSFGFGGANAFAILDDAYHYLKERGLSGFHRTQSNSCELTLGLLPYNSSHWVESRCFPHPKLLVWSSHDEKTAQVMSDIYRELLKRPDENIDRLAYTLALKRSRLSWTSFAIVTSGDTYPSSSDLAISSPIRSSKTSRLGFVFTGQGAQYLGMGKQLLHYPVFKSSIHTLSELLRLLGCSWSLEDLLTSPPSNFPIHEPRYSQPMTTCLQIALVDFLRHLNIIPTIVVGHSSGEIAAAYAAGALSRFSAVKVAFFRGLLSSKIAETSCKLGMMAVSLSVNEVLQQINELRLNEARPSISIGCINSPNSVTLTGSITELDSLAEHLRCAGVFVRKLPIPTAYHSDFMRGITVEYHTSMGSLEPAQATNYIPMISTVTGDFVVAAELSKARYWVDNIVSTVQFSAAISKLLSIAPKKNNKKIRSVGTDLSVTELLEIGPHGALRGPLRECFRPFNENLLPRYIETLDRKQDANFCFLNAVGRLYCAGYPVNLLRANGLPDDSHQALFQAPQYPFNHKTSYWRESRLSRNFRFSPLKRNDLLGTPALDWNPEFAQWRNILRPSELRWLDDHRIGETAIFPAAGMIVIAIEALRQLCSPKETIQGVQIKEVSFLHPIQFRNGNEVETQITLTSQKQAFGMSGWKLFRLFVYEGDQYIECCTGSIKPVFSEHQRPDQSSLSFLGAETLRSWIQKTHKKCLEELTDCYNVCPNTSLYYGPAFRTLSQARLGKHGEATAKLNVSAWQKRDHDISTLTYAVHPSTLDGLAQILVPALAFSSGKELPTMVPTFASYIQVKFVDWDRIGSENLDVTANCYTRGYRGAGANIVATLPNDLEHPILAISGLETTFISDKGDSHGNMTGSRGLCTSLKWAPDIDLLSNQQIFDWCILNRPKDSVNSHERTFERALFIMCFVLEAIEMFDKGQIKDSSDRYHDYITWMKFQQRRLQEDSLIVPIEAVRDVFHDDVRRKERFTMFEKSSIEGAFFGSVGHSLIDVLKGNKDPLDLLIGNSLVDGYYEEMLTSSYHAFPISRYIELLSFKNSAMNILEIGAGTGGQTLTILEALTSNGVNKWSRYDYTDLSPVFFDKARKKFQTYTQKMNFISCDISKDPESQSFKLGTYDLIIASHVMHATVALTTSLSNVRKLLRPGGKFLLVETTLPENLHIGFAFGLLKDWWVPVHNDKRQQNSPCLRTSEWDRKLQQCGFSGVDIEFQGQQDDESYYSSIIISTATEEPALRRNSNRAVIVYDPQSQIQCDISATLKRLIVGSQMSTATDLMKETYDSHVIVIFLVEIEASFLKEISNKDYDCLHSILRRYNKVLWISRSTDSQIYPYHHLIDGLGRVLASEDSTYKFVTAALRSTDDVGSTAQLICQLADKLERSTIKELETNYVLENSMVKIPRVTANIQMNDHLNTALLTRQKKTAIISNTIDVSLVISEPGRLTTLEYTRDAERSHVLAQNEVTVVVKAFGLTNQDYLRATGFLNSTGFAMEAAGIVQQAHEQTGFKPGDRVCVIGIAMATTIAKVPTGAVYRLPETISFTEGASLPVALWLAYYSLIVVARLQPGETVLIYQATSCTGRFAIQIARSIGARVLAIASPDTKYLILRDQMLLQDDDILRSKTAANQGGVSRSTNGLGADVIVGSFESDEEALDSIGLLSHTGRFVDITLYKDTSTSRPSLKLGINQVMASVNLSAMLKSAPLLIHRIFQAAMDFWASNENLSISYSIHTFRASDIEAAFHHFGDHNIVGKRVIELEDGDSIQIDTARTPSYTFSSDATYVIGGGFGGLGRLIARWMASRGAQNLVLLSRSGAKTKAAKNLVTELKEKGVRVFAPVCDISNIRILQKTFSDIQAALPPIKGCIQATVALRDNMFPNMTFDDWSISIASKATGSWNLHKTLPCNLDFFILLSSVNGIFGGRGQANYAAGNTFKDALSHYRIANGQKAVSIDLGLMLSDGMVAEDEFLLKSLRRIGHLMDIEPKELLGLLDYYCDPSLPLLNTDEAQILVGIELPSAVQAKGIDLHHSIIRPIFRHLFQMGEVIPQSLASTSEGNKSRYLSLKDATSIDEATVQVSSWFSNKVGQTLGIAISEIDSNRPVHSYGVDSLVAIELRNWFHHEIDADIAVFEVLGNFTIAKLCEIATERSKILTLSRG